jgi:prepilin-type N-terminal cleavage/methylation domain-containing protein
MVGTKNKCGFTLLEIVVSITIMALMALMISYVFSASNRAVDQGKDQSMLDETARLLLDYIEQDISQALIRTNVAFRVETDGSNNALYFVSTGVRRQLERIRRDTAPMRLQATPVSDWNLQLSIDSPDSGASAATIDDLVRHSDYYYTPSSPAAADFQPVHLQQEEMDHAPVDYTKELQNSISDHAMLTSLTIVVNGNPDWGTGNTDGPPNPADMPRFVDIAIGLTPSAMIKRATSLANDQRALELVAKGERVYTRRIFMRNTGTGALNF